MPRSPRFPPYPARPHSSGQARIAVRGEQFYLGVHGSPRSHAEYERLHCLWRTGRLPAPARGRRRGRTVADLVAAFWAAAEAELYPPRDGAEHPELASYRFALEPVLALYGAAAAEDFRAPELKAVQRALVSGAWRTPEEVGRLRARGKGWGLSRHTANAVLGRVKRWARWCESEGLLPEGRAHHLETVRGLEEGQLGARETDDRGPAPEESVRAVLPHCNHVVRAVLELLLLSAARPKEIRLLTPGDINREGRVEITKGYWVDLGEKVWAVRLKKHKTAHKKQRRVILFGPRAQAILAPFLEGRDPAAYLFSPAEALARETAERRARTGRKLSPAERRRRKRRPAWRAGEFYHQNSLGQSLEAALKRCNRARAAEGLPPVAPFTPYQLRHNAATRLVEQFGWEVARIVLGHTTEEMTRRYGHDDLKKAAGAQGEKG